MENINFRPYQVTDIEFMVNRGRALNANPPGLGKTLETLTAMKRLGPQDTLIISPKIATGVWQHEAMKWYGWDSMKITGDWPKKKRDELRKIYTAENKGLLMINPAMLKFGVQWDFFD